jgi:O-antigen ligase
MTRYMPNRERWKDMDRTSGALLVPSMAIAVGVAASATTVVLMQASIVWVALILIGGGVVIASFLFRDQKLYWLTVFLASVPLNITKMFFLEPEDLFRLRRSYGLVVNEIDIPMLYLSDLPLLVLVALLLSEAIGERKRLRFPRTGFIAVMFIGWCLCSVLVARVPLLSVSWIFYQVKFLIVFLAVVNASRTRGALRLVVATLVFGLAVQGALSVTAFVRQSGHDFYGTLFSASEQNQALRNSPDNVRPYLYVYEGRGLLRGSGTVGVSNETAKFIVPLLPLALAFAIRSTALPTRAYYLGSFILGVAGLLCTFSRGGLLAAGVAVAALGVLMTFRGLLARRSARLALTTSLLGALLTAPALASYLGSRPGYFNMHWEHLQYGLQALFDHAALGVGINNFNVAFTSQEYGGVFSAMAVHNHYLRIAVETGVVGLLLYLAFFFGVARMALRGTRLRDDCLATLSSAILVAFIGVFFYWLDDLFYSVVINTQFWVLAALPFVTHQLSMTDSRPAHAQNDRPVS